jgi:hypothetical protein
MSAEREVIFEFLRIGAALKVTAIDVATGAEASMVGDPHALRRPCAASPGKSSTT